MVAAFCDFSLKADNPSFEALLGTPAMLGRMDEKDVRFVLVGEGDVSDDVVVTFDRREYGAEYTTSTGFTAPVDGTYRLAFSFTANDWDMHMQILVNGVEVEKVYDQIYKSTSRYRSFSTTTVLHLHAGSVVSLKFSCCNNSCTCIKHRRLFEGELLSKA